MSDKKPEKPKPIPGVYEPNYCKIGSFFNIVLLKKYRIIDMYDKYTKEYNNVDFVVNETSMRYPDIQNGRHIVYVPFNNGVKVTRIFNKNFDIGNLRLLVYFYIVKFSVLHRNIGQIIMLCRNQVNPRGFYWNPLVSKIRIRIAILNWKNLCNFDTSKGGRRPYQDYIPVEVLLEDPDALIESEFKKDFCVMHQQIYEIDCNSNDYITSHEIAFVYPMNLNTCMIERKDPPIGNMFADGYFYRVELIEYVQSFQQQVYWSNEGQLRYFLGTGACDLNRNFSRYYAGTSIIGDVRLAGYLYSSDGEQMNINEFVNDVKEELYDMV
jgi:hypothetical protein